MLAAPAAAQETTGAIVGVVNDTSGAVLPGVTVQATGPAGIVNAVSDEKGEFRFPRLPSGVYKVNASLSGFTTRESTVDLTVGTTARVEFALSVSGVTEAVQVSAAAVGVDLTSSATATNISREKIELLPRGRDFTDVVGQAAGAANESQAGGISIDGASGSENRFVIDGIDTTSPQEGTSAVPLRADFLEEVQVKSAGYAAEFGGSTGGVINVITKSGFERPGTAACCPSSRIGAGAATSGRSCGTASRATPSRTSTRPRTTRRASIRAATSAAESSRIGSGSSAPISPVSDSTERTVTFSNGTVNTFDQDFKVHYGTGNVTGNAGSKLLFRGGANFSPYETERSLPGQDGRTSLTADDDWLRGTTGDRRTYSGSVDYVPGARFVLSGRLGRFLTDEESTTVDFPGRDP